ncbi:MAG TPA: hypothetical protein VEI97_05720, partial [bacterium]|nr:hypothetical protein [bacterium]
MPILAVCPYCHTGKVRAPDHAVGRSATCPKCYNCFTIVPAQSLPAAAPAKSKPVAKPQPVPVRPAPRPAAPPESLDQTE